MSHLALFKLGFSPPLNLRSLVLPSRPLHYADRRKEGRKEASVLLMQLQLKLHINILA